MAGMFRYHIVVKQSHPIALLKTNVLEILEQLFLGTPDCCTGYSILRNMYIYIYICLYLHLNL